ncbi:glycosyltransferase family 4 protein [Martelella alba]|uniref:Glycosyltransferase family 4 protein n=1 Tax=Martelella alba TaxID=2590451 RepID=A0ABY2SKF1_9HYPH|nr:glycosyltransferase family 4 protein [Martelella alba]TKI05772.1 glycosyltransferase family 4 protein [Martelella alba]
MQNNKIALVSDWLVTFAGAEKVLNEILKIYDGADLFSVIDFLSDDDRAKILNKKATTTFIQRLPFAKKKYKTYLPFMPFAIEQLDVTKYDIIISSNHAVAKGVITGPDQLHISYVHSPIRYAWDLQFQYLKEANLNSGIKSFFAKYILHKMRFWDSRTANNVDYFIANSYFISRRIQKIYRRNSHVIYPPVDVNKFTIHENKDNYFMTASRMVPYKKIDLIVEAFSAMPDKKLVVIGDGPDMDKIKRKSSKNIEVLGFQPDNILKDYMQKAKAFVFAAEEDFGISPVEAQACGTPVIAYGKGGALETIRPLGVVNPTGLFYYQQDVKSLVEAVNLFLQNADSFKPTNCRNNAEKFSKEVFKTNISTFVEQKWEEFNASKKLTY